MTRPHHMSAPALLLLVLVAGAAPGRAATGHLPKEAEKVQRQQSLEPEGAQTQQTLGPERAHRQLVTGTGAVGPATGTTTATSLLTLLSQLLGGGGVSIGTDVTTGALGGVAGSLALLAAAVKAPVVALYQIGAEVVVMVALILFISYIASLLGIDDFRRRTLELEEERSSGWWSSLGLDDLTNRVSSALEHFDAKTFLEDLDTRYH